MNHDQHTQTIFEKISADMMLDSIRTMVANNRWADINHWNQTADYICQQLHAFGLDAERLDLSLDGETAYGDAVLPMAWDCEDATLEVTEPVPEVIARHSDCPNLVGMWSPPTPEEGIEGDVAYIPGADPILLDQHDVKDRFILTDARPSSIRLAAEERGALGIISGWMPYPDCPNAVQWISANSRQPGGWGPKKDEEPMIQLAISPKAMDRLGRTVNEQTARVRVKIKSRLHAATLPVLHARIAGTHVIQDTQDNVEVLLMAPLYGQGANDSAVSAAALLEAARVLQAAIDEGDLPRPIRGIRFLWVPKVYGPLAFAHEHKAILDRTIFCLNLDAGAGDPDLSWSRWSYRFGSIDRRHFSDGFVWKLCQNYLQSVRPQRALERREFSLSSDVWFNDPALNVATHWLTGGTSKECKHTDLDTVETVDKRSCIDLAAVAAGMMYGLASISPSDVPLYASWNYNQLHQSMQEQLQAGLGKALAAKSGNELSEAYTESRRHLSLRTELEARTLQSLETLAPDIQNTSEWETVSRCLDSLRNEEEAAQSVLRAAVQSRALQLGAEMSGMDESMKNNTDQRVPLPEGLSLGTITLDDLPQEQWKNPVKRSPRRNLPLILAWWLMDCKRTVSEIEEIVRMECGAFRECIPVWFDFLREHGYVIFEHEEQEVQAAPEAQEESTSEPEETVPTEAAEPTEPETPDEPKEDVTETTNEPQT